MLKMSENEQCTYLSQSKLIASAKEWVGILQKWLDLLDDRIDKLLGKCFSLSTLGALKWPKLVVDFAEIGVDEEVDSGSLQGPSGLRRSLE